MDFENACVAGKLSNKRHFFALGMCSFEKLENTPRNSKTRN